MVRGRCIAASRAVAAAMVLVLATGPGVLAQSPTPKPEPAYMGGGVAASMTGDPILAAVGVIALGVGAALATLLVTASLRWVRPRTDV